MVNDEIAAIFERLAQVLTFQGKDHFRALAYGRAAVSLRSLEQDVSELARSGRLGEIPGIGHDLSVLIEEYLATGHMRRAERAIAAVPAGVLDLLAIPGLGPKTLALIYHRFPIKNIDDLKRLIGSGALQSLRGFGEKKIASLQRGIELWQAGQQRMLLSVALPIAEKLLTEVRQLPGVTRADIAGSVRRRRETIGDLDLVIVSDHSAEVLRDFARLPSVKQVLAQGATRATVLLDDRLQVDVRAVPAESYGAALQYFTGAQPHTVRLRTLAQARGLKLNEYGLFRGDQWLAGRDEEELYRALGLTVMPPELREDRGEIEAAMKDHLPKLVSLDDLRGDLHMHTSWSDGAASIAEMADAAAQSGYDYIAITDHTASARIAHGLDVARLEAKMAELDELRAQRGRRKPRLLLGAEVDILPDGRLDYPDAVLARLDVVVASLHSAFRQSRDRMTGRLLEAMANPYVHIIGHPTTRLIGRRDPVDFDFEKIVQAAADTGVALEINGAPGRLDLSDQMARTAQAAGVRLAIDSDAHSAAQLANVRYGVFQARRGWITADSVVNTWPWAKFNQWLQQRRHHSPGASRARIVRAP